MCDQATIDIISEVVREKVDADEMFTAFDVSLLVKERGSQERHRHMKGEVHREMEQYAQSGLYNRKLHDVGATSDAWLYFPSNADPSQYQPVPRKDSPQSAPKPALAATVVAAPVSTPSTPTSSTPTSSTPTPSITAIGSPDDSDDGDLLDQIGRLPDARGQVWVPTFLLSAADIKPGEVAYVWSKKDQQDRKSLVIGTRVPSGHNPLTSYTVLEKHGSFRVTKHTFSLAGLDATKGIDFERVDNNVYARQHG